MEEFSGDKRCRICFKKQDTTISLFRKRKGISPCEKLNKLGLKIGANDSGPTCICYLCLEELETTLKFLEKCEKANEKLSERFIRETEPRDLSSDFNIECNLPNSTCIDTKVADDVPHTIVDRAAVQSIASISDALYLEEKCLECGSRRRCRHWAPPASHTCPLCLKVFNRKFNFKVHLKRHSGQHEHWCGVCGAGASSAALARRHCGTRVRRACAHPGCGRTYTTNTNLRTHMRTHTGERPFECSHCSKKFTSRNTLNDHVRIHTGVKPYICPVCGKRFTTNKLAAHLRRHRPRPPPSRAPQAPHAPRAPRAPHACALCPARYRHKQSLNKHTRKQHTKPACGETNNADRETDGDLQSKVF